MLEVCCFILSIFFEQWTWHEQSIKQKKTQYECRKDKKDEDVGDYLKKIANKTEWSANDFAYGVFEDFICWLREEMYIKTSKILKRHWTFLKEDYKKDSMRRIPLGIIAVIETDLQTIVDDE